MIVKKILKEYRCRKKNNKERIIRAITDLNHNVLHFEH